MKVLLDTHVLLWWLEGGARLSRRARSLMQSQETTVLVSAVSAWEIAIKSEAGKLEVGGLLVDFHRELEQEGFSELPISVRHAVQAGLLKRSHKDPFDRMLIAQAQAENVPLVSRDKVFDSYAVRRVW